MGMVDQAMSFLHLDLLVQMPFCNRPLTSPPNLYRCKFIPAVSVIFLAGRYSFVVSNHYRLRPATRTMFEAALHRVLFYFQVVLP